MLRWDLAKHTLKPRVKENKQYFAH